MKLSALIVTFLVAIAPAWAQQPPADATSAVTNDGRHTLNLKDADIQALIATVSEITGRNFIVAPNVTGKVTVISGRPMKPDEIYDVFLSVLRVHGYAAVPSGSMIKIVPEAQAQQDGSAGIGAAGRSSDEVITQIVPVKHVAVTDLLPVLRPLMPQGAQLIANGSSNSLVISDRASNVSRIMDIIRRIDTVSEAEVEVIPLSHANATEVARTLTTLAGNDTAQPGGSAKVFADTRTNSILLSGSKTERLRMRALLVHLDTPLDSGGATQVVYLNYASAKDLVPILQGVASTLTGEAPPSAGPSVASALGAAAGITLPSSGASPSGASGGIATIQAHEQTNALVISAPPAIFRSLQSVIRQLDVRRAQVLIEAVIAEVADTTASELGVQWFTAPQSNDGTLGQGVIGGTNFPGPNGNSSLLGLSGNAAGLGGLG
mgnify:CR=1 FL=1